MNIRIFHSVRGWIGLTNQFIVNYYKNYRVLSLHVPLLFYFVNIFYDLTSTLLCMLKHKLNVLIKKNVVVNFVLKNEFILF
jgi:hypothetical protein